MLTSITSVGSVLNISGRMLRITGCGTCSRRWWCRGRCCWCCWGCWWRREICTATTFLRSSYLAAGPRNISGTGELENNLSSTSGLVGRLAWTGHHLDTWMGTTGYWGLESGHWATIHGSSSDISLWHVTWWDTRVSLLRCWTRTHWSPGHLIIRHGGAYNEGVDRSYHTPTSSAEFMILGILECVLLVSSTFLIALIWSQLH